MIAQGPLGALLQPRAPEPERVTLLDRIRSAGPAPVGSIGKTFTETVPAPATPGPYVYSGPQFEPQPEYSTAKTTVVAPVPQLGPIPQLTPSHWTIDFSGLQAGLPQLQYGAPDLTPERNQIIQIAPFVGPTPPPIVGPDVTQRQQDTHNTGIGKGAQEFGIAKDLEFPDLFGWVGDAKKWLLIGGVAVVGLWLAGKYLGRSRK